MGDPGSRETGGATLSEFAGVGIQFAAVILIFAFGGIWLDRRLGTSPVFLLIGVFAGAGGGFYSMYRKLMAAQRRGADAARAKGRGMPGGDGQP